MVEAYLRTASSGESLDVALRSARGPMHYRDSGQPDRNIEQIRLRNGAWEILEANASKPVPFTPSGHLTNA